MSNQKKLSGEILVEKKLITPEQLKLALLEQATTKEFLGRILLKHKWINEKDLLVTLSERFNMPLVDLKGQYIDWKMVREFDPSLILDFHCVPLQKDARSVTMAITNPLDAWSIKKAEEEAKGLDLKFVLTSEEDIGEAIKRYRDYVQKSLTDLFD
ncbi:MAG: hypothetical protein HZA28_04750 [Candidatus Omnitrophica bacterium]|nr:hypothetical protein [Candidatus Omnitrophota bacterium]